MKTLKIAVAALSISLAAAFTDARAASAALVCVDFDGDGAAESCVEIDEDLPNDNDDLPEDVHLPGQEPLEVDPVEG